LTKATFTETRKRFRTQLCAQLVWNGYELLTNDD